MAAWPTDLEAHLGALVVPDPWAGMSSVHGGHVPAVDPEAFVPPTFRLRGLPSGREWDVADGIRGPAVEGATPPTGPDEHAVEAADVVTDLVPTG
jgi:hypothetical protein